MVIKKIYDVNAIERSHVNKKLVPAIQNDLASNEMVVKMGILAKFYSEKTTVMKISI